MSDIQKPKRYNNYSLAIISAFVAGLVASLVLLLTAHGALGEMPTWLYQLLCAIFGMVSVSQIVSGAGYSFTGFDIMTNGNVTAVELLEFAVESKPAKYKILHFMKTRKMEFVGLVIGFLAGLTLTVILAVKKAADVFATALPVVGGIVFFIQNVSAMSGLFSRLGRTADYFRANSKSLRGRNVNYVLSVLIGVGIGIILGSVFLGVAGVTSVMTAGGALPLWFGGALFFISTVSVCASSSGYIGRVFDFFLGRRALGMSKDSTDRGLRSRLNAERIGTIIGITVGLALGITLIATGLVLTPLFGAGLPLWAAGILVMATGVSSMGGLGNRLGYFVDTLRGYRGDNEHAVDNGDKLNGNPLGDCRDPTVALSWGAAPQSKYVYSRVVNTDPSEEKGAPVEQKRTEWTTTPATKGTMETLQVEMKKDDVHENDIDRGRRSSDSGHVEPCADASGISRVGSAGCTFFGKNNCTTLSGSHPARLDAPRDVWYQLRQKAESGKIHTTSPHHYDYRTCGRREQIERVGNSRRLRHQAAVAA